MLIGTILWSLTHLIANGTMASIVLFGSFLIYSIIDILLAKKRDSLIPKGDPSVIHDVIALMAGIMLYVAFLYGHEIIFGLSVI